MQIEKIEIEKFRGIREGLIDGLSPLSILVGPNNCGKSAVLETIYLAWATRASASQVPIFLRRRGGPIQHAQTSFMHNATSPSSAKFTLSGTPEAWESKTTLEVAATRNSDAVKEARASGLEEPILQYNFSSSLTRENHGMRSVNYRQLVDSRGRRASPTVLAGSASVGLSVSFVDVDAVRTHGQLEECYSRLEKWNALQDVLAALRLSTEDLKDLRILQSEGEFILHLTHARQQPSAAYLAGDGFKRFIALGAAILDGEDDVVVLEEPESYLHPRYVRELVSLLHGQVRKGKQVILCTHSHELIDQLLAPNDDSGEPIAPTIHRLRLIEGVLRSVTVSAENARTIRDELFEDLRA